MSRFSIESIFTAIDRFSGPVRAMERNVGDFSRKAELNLRRVNRSIDRMTRSAQQNAKAMLAMGVAAAYTGARILSTGIDFEQAITNVGAVGLQTRAQIAPLEALALQLGRDTKFTATEAANAMELLAKAGFNTNQILSATPAVLSAAAASGMEIAEVAGHVSNVLKGMGLEADQASRVSDVLALASVRTNSSIGSLAESVSKVASTARQLNMPLEHVVSSVALLQDMGIEASVAGSSFTTTLIKMAAPSRAMQKQMDALGLSFKNANGDMLTLPEVMSRLNTASQKLGGNFDKVAFFAQLVGLEGQKAVTSLTEMFASGKSNELHAELLQSLGVAEKMSKLRMDTVKGSLELLSSAVDAVKVRIFGLNNGALRDTVDRMTAWVTANEELIATKVGDFLAKILANLPEIVTWIKRIATGAAVLFTFVKTLQAISLALGVINLLMLASPIGLLVAGIIAATVALAALAFWGDDIIAWLEDLPALARAAFAPFEALVRAIRFVKNNADLVVDIVTGKADYGQVARDVGGGLLDFAKSGGVARYTPVGALVGGAVGMFKDDAPAPPPAQIVTPAQQTAQAIESSSVQRSEVTIRDQTGRAEVTKGPVGNGFTFEKSGAF